MEILNHTIGYLIILMLGTLIIPLPFADHRKLRYRSLPWMTLALIVVNVAVYVLWQWPQYVPVLHAQTDIQETEALINYYTHIWTYGFRADFMRSEVGIGAFTSFTSMFMHGSVGHLIGNMIFLWAFAPRVEDACGPWRFLLYYLLAGIVTALVFGIVIAPAYDRPSVGASGAISGVMGAYLVLFPGNKIGALWIGGALVLRPLYALICLIRRRPRERFRWVVPLPALLLVGYFIVFDIAQTFETLQTRYLDGGVNYLAHVAGFLTAIVVLLFVRKDVFTRYIAGRSL